MNLVRNQNTTKHDYGHALLVAGAHGRMGCAILAARAALRSGCGLLTVHLPSRCVDPMQAAFPEAMVSVDPCADIFTAPPTDLGRYQAIAVGPGLGTDSRAAEAFATLLDRAAASAAHPTLVLDADALNIMAGNSVLLSKVARLGLPVVVTPHEGEYRRLFGDTPAAEVAKAYSLIVVRKDHRTEIWAPDGSCRVNHTGNAGMATAGSGDVLTGIILGMLCSNHLHANPYDIVCRAVEIHGKIGDLAVEKQSESSLIASDLIENLKNVSTDMTVI